MSAQERDQFMQLHKEREASGYYNVVPRPYKPKPGVPSSRKTGRYARASVTPADLDPATYIKLVLALL
jgi:hypothetical protein